MTNWEPLLDRWLWVLVHSLWQSSVIALALWAILRLMPARKAERRYAMALVAFTLAAACPIATWAWLSPPSATLTPVAHSAPTSNGPNLFHSNSSGNLQTGSSGGAKPVAQKSIDGTKEPAATPGSPHAPIQTPAGAHVPERATRSWSLILVLLWAAGAALQLVRTARDLSATRRLLQGDLAPGAELASCLARVARRLRLRRRFDVVLTERFVGPCVFGLWKPALVLPAALISGLTPDQLDAVLLHELAHLRRYDDVVNLIQRLVEALFFFNPALRWTSRIVRRERETACDALAAASLTSPLSLAEALVRVADLAGQLGPMQLAALNFAEANDSGSLLDRVRRIVRPEDRPRLKLTWPALLGFVCLLVVLCCGIERATLWSVAIAKDWLSPEQRIAAVAEALKESGPIDRGVPGQKFRVKGTFRTADGKPIPDGPGHLYSISQQASGGGTSSQGGSESVTGDRFDVSLPPGECWLLYFAKGFAPAIAGPFRGKGGELRENAEIVLHAGVTGAVRVVDREGTPIPQASIVAVPDWGVGMILGPSLPEATDENGFWKSTHLADVPYRLTIRASGFGGYGPPRPQRISNDPLVIVLDPAKVVVGTVVDASGQLVGAAQIRLVKDRRANNTRSFGDSGDVVAESNAEGVFQLQDLAVDHEYDFLIDAGERGHAILSSVRADSEALRVELQKKLTLAGEVRGDLSRLLAEGPVSLSCVSPTDGPRSSRHSSAKLDASGRFRLEPLFPGRYQLSLGRHVINGSLRESTTEFVIDLAELEKSRAAREIEVRFVDGAEAVKPGGTVGVQMEILDERDRRTFGGPRGIVDGTVRFRINTPSTLRLVPEGCLGYWFEDVELPVPSAAEPFVAEIPVLPAGALRVKVLSPEGRQKNSSPLSAGVAFLVNTPRGERHVSIHKNGTGSDEIVLSPVPLDTPCLVSASQQYRSAFAPILQLDGSDPIRGLSLAIPSAVNTTIRVEGSTGERLARIPLEVNYSPPAAQGRKVAGHPSPGGHTWSSDQNITDRDGELTLGGLPAHESGFTITAKPNRDWQPGQVIVRTDGGMTHLKLERGEVLEGTVVDEKTNRGVPGLEVRAQAAAGRRNGPWEFFSEGSTDTEGRFRFSNLPARAVKVIPWGVSLRSPQPELIPGGNEPIVIKVQVPPQ